MFTGKSQPLRRNLTHVVIAAVGRPISFVVADLFFLVTQPLHCSCVKWNEKRDSNLCELNRPLLSFFFVHVLNHNPGKGVTVAFNLCLSIQRQLERIWWCSATYVR